MADNKSATPNINGLAIFNVLKDVDAPLSFAEIADRAGIEAKTGYLTAARKIAKTNGFELKKFDKAVTVTVNTVTEYPSGLRVEKAKETVLDGYALVALPADAAKAD